MWSFSSLSTCGEKSKWKPTQNQVRSFLCGKGQIQIIENGAVSISRQEWKTDLYFLWFLVCFDLSHHNKCHKWRTSGRKNVNNVVMPIIIIIMRKYSMERRRAGLSVTPLPPPLTGLHLTLLKGRWGQARCAHLPGAKGVCVYSLHPQTWSNTWAQRTCWRNTRTHAYKYKQKQTHL